MAELTRDEIIARRTGVETVKFTDGATIKVRGLTRAEADVMRRFEAEHEDDVIGLEALALSIGIVSPSMTAEDTRLWLEHDAHGEIQKAINKIQELSGQLNGQPKEYLKSVPRRR